MVHTILNICNVYACVISISLFLIFLQLFLFPLVTKWAGFRNTFRLGIVTFGLMAFLLPFSNRITGLIVPSNSSVYDNSMYSGRNLFEEETEHFCNYTQIVNSSFDSSVNVNSVLRVPFQIWFVLISIVTVATIGRFVDYLAILYVHSVYCQDGWCQRTKLWLSHKC